jgi:hypothetical protein
MANVRRRLIHSPMTKQAVAARFLRLAGILLISQAITSCGAGQTGEDIPRNWLKSGSVVVSNGVPAVTTNVSAGTLGFAPSTSVRQGAWLLIETKQRRVTLMEGDKAVESGSGLGLERLTTGNFQLLHKQRNPLWYAPDSYFSARHLNSPASGDKNRYFRGALGDFALFVTKDTPLHSGPVWVPEIGGAQLEDNLISKLYYSLSVGAPIEVR